MLCSTVRLMQVYHTGKHDFGERALYTNMFIVMIIFYTNFKTVTNYARNRKPLLR